MDFNLCIVEQLGQWNDEPVPEDCVPRGDLSDPGGDRSSLVHFPHYGEGQTSDEQSSELHDVGQQSAPCLGTSVSSELTRNLVLNIGDLTTVNDREKVRSLVNFTFFI